ncbi:hypothetical protein [Oceaniglobus indicus]|uniref:hypothetical protein n=1 Tax=Oceaniglobus indicus TaxID=2047749 RepID=UPI000C19847E|nr:hypothetical protein [Oceaniglobus indicus]
MTRLGNLLLLGLALAATGCGVRQSLGFGPAQPADVLPFEAKLSESDDDIRAFTVQVQAGGAGLDVTRESVRFPATAHCLQSFGDTEIDWQLDASGDWAGMPLEGGDMVYAGRCAGR